MIRFLDFCREIHRQSSTKMEGAWYMCCVSDNLLLLIPFSLGELYGFHAPQTAGERNAQRT
jgi:hypothetical protein